MYTKRHTGVCWTSFKIALNTAKQAGLWFISEGDVWMKIQKHSIEKSQWHHYVLSWQVGLLKLSRYN